MLMKHPFKETVLVYLDEEKLDKCEKLSKESADSSKALIYFKEALLLFSGIDTFWEDFDIDCNIFDKGDDYVIVEIKSIRAGDFKMDPIVYLDSFFAKIDFKKASVFI